MVSPAEPATKEPRDLAVLKALTALLEGITYGNGYPYDLRGRVFRGRLRFGADESPPMLSILEAPNPDDRVLASAAEFGRVSLEPWSVLIQGWAIDDPANPTDPAYYLKAAVEKRLSAVLEVRRNGEPADPDSYMLGRRVAGLVLRRGLVRPPTEGVSELAFFYLPVVINMPTDPLTPYED